MTEGQIQSAPAESVESPETPSTVQVNDLTQFVHILVGWHQKQVASLQHLLQIPDTGDISVTMTDRETKQDTELVLKGDSLQGFKVGIQAALTALGTLPFAVQYDSPQEAKNGLPGGEVQEAPATPETQTTT